MSDGIDWDAVIGELQKPDGWVKGDLGYPDSTDGPVCLRGALMRVDGHQTDLTGAARKADDCLDEIIREQFPERVTTDGDWFSAVAPFNDHDDTTLADVVAVCEKARAAYGERAPGGNETWREFDGNCERFLRSRLAVSDGE